MNADRDPDGDGLSCREECLTGTDPLKRDTDGDGISDSDEIGTWRTNPSGADSDSDGLVDGAELDWGCNPLDSDTDGDRVIDGVEVRYAAKPGTVAQNGLPKLDPVGYDGDDDGVCDYDAYWSGIVIADEWNSDLLVDSYLDVFRPFASILWKSPFVASETDAQSDFDGDGFPVWLETLFGTSDWDADEHPVWTDGTLPKFRMTVSNTMYAETEKAPVLDVDGRRIVLKGGASYEVWIDEGAWNEITLLGRQGQFVYLTLSCDYGQGETAKVYLEDSESIFNDRSFQPMAAWPTAGTTRRARICQPALTFSIDPVVFHGDELRTTVACRILPEGLWFRSD